MTHKPTLDGYRARQLFGEQAHIAQRIVNNLTAAALARIDDDDPEVIRALKTALQDALTLSRVMGLLESGQIEAAEILLHIREKE